MTDATKQPGLGLSSATALVVANMIGVGVFTSSGFALVDLAPGHVLCAWALGGVLALLGAISYGALSQRMPESGGEYHFLAAAVHPLAGFMAGWVSLLAGFTAPIAAAAAAFAAYAMPGQGADSAAARAVATSVIVAAGVAHGVRRSGGVWLQNVVVALKLLLIVGFIVVGLPALPATPSPGTSGPFDLGAFAVTLVWVSVSYSGWNATAYVASEVRDARHVVRRSMLLATVAVIFVYLALNTVFVYAAPPEVLAGQAEIAAVAAEALGGAWLRDVVRCIVVLALFSSVSAMVMAGPRVYARMADDGLFPRWFSRRGELPVAAIALQVGLSLVAVWADTLRGLLSYIGFTLGLSTAATVAVLIRLRLREGAGRVPVPGFPWVPTAYVAASLAIAWFFASREPERFAAGIATVLVGIPLYFVFARRRGTISPG